MGMEKYILTNILISENKVIKLYHLSITPSSAIMTESVTINVLGSKTARAVQAPGEIPPFYKFDGRMESLGQTKIRNLGGFFFRNISPSSLLYRYFGFMHRTSKQHFDVPRASIKPFFVIGGIGMVVMYAIDYHGGHIKSARWRKYH